MRARRPPAIRFGSGDLFPGECLFSIGARLDSASERQLQISVQSAELSQAFEVTHQDDARFRADEAKTFDGLQAKADAGAPYGQDLGEGGMGDDQARRSCLVHRLDDPPCQSLVNRIPAGEA